jgi:hypothetical protein
MPVPARLESHTLHHMARAHKGHNPPPPLTTMNTQAPTSDGVSTSEERKSLSQPTNRKKHHRLGGGKARANRAGVGGADLRVPTSSTGCNTGVPSDVSNMLGGGATCKPVHVSHPGWADAVGKHCVHDTGG